MGADPARHGAKSRSVTKQMGSHLVVLVFLQEKGAHQKIYITSSCSSCRSFGNDVFIILLLFLVSVGVTGGLTFGDTSVFSLLSRHILASLLEIPS